MWFIGNNPNEKDGVKEIEKLDLETLRLIQNDRNDSKSESDKNK